MAHGAEATDVTLGPVFVPDVLDELRARVSGLGLGGVVVEDGPPVVVDADAQRLAQSLLNLVVNADTHTPAGTAVRVTATPGDDGGEPVVRLAVTDDGPGIDPAVRDAACEPFVTTRASGTRRGRGLGLSVVKALTEAQGGTVEPATGPGGTTVTIVLPRAA